MQTTIKVEDGNAEVEDKETNGRNTRRQRQGRKQGTPREILAWELTDNTRSQSLGVGVAVLWTPDPMPLGKLRGCVSVSGHWLSTGPALPLALARYQLATQPLSVAWSPWQPITVAQCTPPCRRTQGSKKKL